MNHSRMIRIDLHLHSTFSDGSMTPEALVAHGRSKGIAVLSLTDHDTVDGLPSFMAACARWNMAGIPGIELSAEHPRTVHILGYRLDLRRTGNSSTNVGMKRALEAVRRGRDERNELMCENLREMGVDISLEEVVLEAGGDVVARPHMAKVLVRKGYAQDIVSAFSRYLSTSSRAYVERYRLSPAKCIELITDAGGLAVLAHPAQTTSDFSELREIVRELKDAGLWGIECASSRASGEQVFRYLSLAADFSLFPTAGNDFHGTNRPSASMGVAVSEDFLPWARLGVTL